MDAQYPNDELAAELTGKTRSLTQGVNYIAYVLVGSSLGYCFQVLFEGPAHAAEAAPLLLALAVWPFVHNALDFPWRQQALNAVYDQILALRRDAADEADLYERLKHAGTQRNAFLLNGFPVAKSAALGWLPPLGLLALIHVGA